MRFLALISMLLAAGSVVAAECTTLYNGKTLANWARRGDLDAVKALINGGCDINALSASPQVSNTLTDTPLTSASKSKKSKALDVIKWLIDNEVNINLRDSSNQTPLMVASSHNNVGAARLLIRAGAHTDVSDSYHTKIVEGESVIVNTGRTALNFARSHEMFELLITYGVPVDYVTSSGMTALHNAAETVRDGYIVDLMVAKVGSTSFITNTRIYATVSPLMMASMQDSSSRFMRRLIHHGAKLEAIAPNSYKTALHRAAEYGHISNVRQLIKAGANVNAGRSVPGGKGPIFSAIEGAIREERTEVVKTLIAAGSKVTDAAGNKPSIPIHYKGSAALKAIIDNPKPYWPIRAYTLGIPYNSIETSWIHVSCHETGNSCLVYMDCTDDSGAKTGNITLSAGASALYSNSIPIPNTTTISSGILGLGITDSWKGRLDCAVRSQQRVTAQVWYRPSELINNTSYIRSDKNNEAILQRVHSEGSDYDMDLRIRCIDSVECKNTVLKCRKTNGRTPSSISSISVGKIDRLKTTTLYNYARGEIRSDIPGPAATCTVKSEGAFLVQMLGGYSGKFYNHTGVSME